MHIPDLHEFMRAPWLAHPERVVDFEWQGHHFWLRMRGSNFLFKKDALDSSVWGAIFAEQQLNSGASPDELRSHFVEKWSEGRVGRLLALPDPMPPHSAVLVGVSASRFWLPMNDSASDTETTHSAKWAGDLWELTEKELGNLLLPDWANATSMPRRAWEWHRLDSVEKSWSQLKWINGSRQELENLTRAMAHSDTQFWGEHSFWATNYQLFADGKSKVHSLRGRGLFTTMPPPRIVRLGQIFLDYNRSHLQRPPLLPPLLPPLTPARGFSPDGDAFLHLRFSAPSQHEKLEAHLLLRTWLQDKISAQEIEHLMPPI